MRFFPVLTAILVCVGLFLVVLQREALLRFAAELTGDAPEPGAAIAETAPAAQIGRAHV